MTNPHDARTILITGAGSGIGKATAERFHNEGWSVALVDRDEEHGRRAAEALSRDGATCAFFRCDVSDEADVAALLEDVTAELGGIDAAFNNAGIEGEQGATTECTADNFDRIIAVNLRGVWLCLRAELKHMAQQGHGVIVNCSSVAGLIGMPGIPAYVASKHGVIGLTRTAALEHARQNIRVNAVCPGAIETPMLERYMSSTEGGREAMEATEPVGRIGHPEEIADAVFWLCSDRASFVTGHALPVDGGWTAG
ncbi:SDR family NAD(P)-dependent oxidoreductase [Stakelama marina]|uniref:SDR family oxidoreductase n=1 Tax=Stakelama marina TaxID=2826939 RepID=A0A8T4I8R6_9SPHN|nr:glucose 1-dehydrogenase [Stakelama marina]MBR0551047.1 SDR family oxidoreductase [Stakelama marina]